MDRPNPRIDNATIEEAEMYVRFANEVISVARLNVESSEALTQAAQALIDDACIIMRRLIGEHFNQSSKGAQ